MNQINFGPILRKVEETRIILDRHIDDVEVQIGDVSSDLSDTRSDVAELKSLFETFLMRNERQRLIQLAETKKASLKDELDRSFGHYSVVRRTSVGMLQAFDVGNVRNNTVHQISEELMIQTPRYWLAPALVGLAAWSKDDKELAEKSVEAAFGRDPKKTSLFFALVLRRQHRLGEAARWLRHYFQSLDAYHLTREFAILQEAIAQAAFGPDGKQLVMENLETWREMLSMEPEIEEKQVSQWVGEVDTHRGRINDEDFPKLSQISPTWSELKEMLEKASAHEFILEKYVQVRDTNTPLTGSSADRLDDLLDILVTEYDAEELPLRREVLFQDSIIEHDGDEVRAREQADLNTQALDETLDALSLQTQTAFRPHLLGVSTSSQKIAVSASRVYFERGISRYTKEYRAKAPHEAALDFDRSHSNYASQYGFTHWSTTTSVPQEQVETGLREHWDSVMHRYIESMRFTIKQVILHIFVAVLAVLLGIALFNAWQLLGLLVLIGGAVIPTYLIHQKKKNADAAVEQAEKTREKAKDVSIQLYREASAEWVDAKLDYDDADAREEDVLDMVKGWPL